MGAQELPANWVSQAATQLTSNTADGNPGGDLITKGLTTGSIANVGLAAAAGTVGTALVAFLGNFKDKPTLAVAAAVIIAGVSLAAAIIVAADLSSRAKVNSARLAAVGSVVSKEVTRIGSPNTASAPAAEATQGTASQMYATAVPIVGFDVGAKGSSQHLLAAAWTPTTGETPASVIYLVADEGEGPPAWTTDVFGVQRVKLSSPAAND